jgi:hypothetical protein
MKGYQAISTIRSQINGQDQICERARGRGHAASTDRRGRVSATRGDGGLTSWAQRQGAQALTGGPEDRAWVRGADLDGWICIGRSRLDWF